MRVSGTSLLAALAPLIGALVLWVVLPLGAGAAPSEGDLRDRIADSRAREGRLAADAETFGQSVYNITGGTQITLSRAAEIVREVIPGAEIEIGPGYTHLDRQGPYDISAAERDLGYTPQWTVERGIRDYVGWLRDHPY